MQREKPYQALTSRELSRDGSVPSGTLRQVFTWLSSARVVRCWVKSRNERNPYPYLPALRVGTLRRLPVTNRRKERMMSSHHRVTTAWATHVLQWGTQRAAKPPRWSKSQKTSRSSDLESATRLHEVGIASNRESACRGEYVPGPCTHRPSHHESWLYQKLPS